MKMITYLLAILFASAINHDAMQSNKVKKQLFQQVIDRQYSNYIELYGNRDSMKGVFFGVEFTQDRAPVYYKAELDSINWQGNNIYFTLDKYVYSMEAFYPHKPKTLLEPHDKRIPPSMQLQQNFSGTAFAETLDLRKVTAAYFNHGDRMIFVKVANPSERK